MGTGSACTSFFDTSLEGTTVVEDDGADGDSGSLDGGDVDGDADGDADGGDAAWTCPTAERM